VLPCPAPEHLLASEARRGCISCFVKRRSHIASDRSSLSCVFFLWGLVWVGLFFVFVGGLVGVRFLGDFIGGCGGGFGLVGGCRAERAPATE